MESSSFKFPVPPAGTKVHSTFYCSLICFFLPSSLYTKQSEIKEKEERRQLQWILVYATGGGGGETFLHLSIIELGVLPKLETNILTHIKKCVLPWLCLQFFDFPQVTGVGNGWYKTECWFLGSYVLVRFYDLYFLMFTVILLKCWFDVILIIPCFYLSTSISSDNFLISCQIQKT